MANNENTRAPAGGPTPGATDSERAVYWHQQYLDVLCRLDRATNGAATRCGPAASAPASAPLPLTDDRIVDCAVSAGLHDEMWFGQDTPKGYEDCMPKLRAFARLIALECLAAAPVADERAIAQRLELWEPGIGSITMTAEELFAYGRACRAALSGGSPEPVEPSRLGDAR